MSRPETQTVVDSMKVINISPLNINRIIVCLVQTLRVICYWEINYLLLSLNKHCVFSTQLKRFTELTHTVLVCYTQET